MLRFTAFATVDSAKAACKQEETATLATASPKAANAKREAEQSVIQAPTPLTKKRDSFKQLFPFKGI